MFIVLPLPRRLYVNLSPSMCHMILHADEGMQMTACTPLYMHVPCCQPMEELCNSCMLPFCGCKHTLLSVWLISVLVTVLVTMSTMLYRKRTLPANAHQVIAVTCGPRLWRFGADCSRINMEDV